MVVASNGKSAFEQRLGTIPPKHDSDPACSYPAPVGILNPCISFKKLILMAIDRLCSVHLAILIQVCHNKAFGDDSMIGFQNQLDLLLSLVEGEGDIELGKGVDAL